MGLRTGMRSGRTPMPATEPRTGGMDAMRRDIQHAARRLLRSPAFTLAAVSTLALAIGANASIFAVVERVVLNPLPYPDSDRLIRSFQKLRALDPGFDATSALSF